MEKKKKSECIKPPAWMKCYGKVYYWGIMTQGDGFFGSGTRIFIGERLMPKTWYMSTQKGSDLLISPDCKESMRVAK